MNLEIQIQSLIVSFVFGLFVSLLYNLLYFILYNRNKIILVISNLFFSISLSLLYFYIMFIINDANIHPYFISLMVIGFILGNIKTKKIRTKVKVVERKQT